MNEIAKSTANLPASVAAMQGLSQSVVAIASGTGGGEQYMKMTKFGEFVFGAEHLEVEEEAEWAVNPTQFTHGWICWGTKANGNDGECLGEIMVSASKTLPEEDSLPEAKGNWTKQVGISLLCLNGADQDIQCVFKTNSLGGKKAYTALVTEVVSQMDEGSDALCPVVKLETSHYTHKKYGKIFTPIFEILEWMTIDGITEEAEAEPEPEPEPPKRTRKTRTKAAPKKKTRRKAAAKKEPEPEAETENPEPEEDAEPETEKPVRRRRRR